jgi:hypothetical protein
MVKAFLWSNIMMPYEGLRKAESLLGIQLTTGENGLDAFLLKARVPSVLSPLCSCGGGQQMEKHILIFCPRYAGARHKLRYKQGRLPNFSRLLATAEGLQ